MSLVTLPNVILVLSDTIAAKQQYLKSLEENPVQSMPGYAALAMVDRAVQRATVEFLKLNIDELEKILADLKEIQS